MCVSTSKTRNELRTEYGQTTLAPFSEIEPYLSSNSLIGTTCVGETIAFLKYLHSEQALVDQTESLVTCSLQISYHTPRSRGVDVMQGLMLSSTGYLTHHILEGVDDSSPAPNL